MSDEAITRERFRELLDDVFMRYAIEHGENEALFRRLEIERYADQQLKEGWDGAIVAAYKGQGCAMSEGAKKSADDHFAAFKASREE